MPPTLTRRGLLAAGVALAAAPLLPARARAVAHARSLVATTRTLDVGVPARLVAVDGEDVEPVEGTRFGLSMAQRLDLLIDLPAGGGAFPVLALREAAPERAGIVLATPGAAVPRIPVTGEAPSPLFDLDFAQEARLRPLRPLPERAPDRAPTLVLDGGMAPYLWTIDGRAWPDPRPVEAGSGERVEITFRNVSAMAHPMHLHGHVFQVVGFNGRRFGEAVRDTVMVPPRAAVTVALDAGEAARWALHCHHMPHMDSGMMTELHVSA
jgi:FtsP/CotA-like multicopper oxidase with cupredoxin domain